MTISLERAGVEPLSMVDAYDVPHAVVTVQVVVTRDQLAAAVQIGAGDFYGGERHPDELTVDEVRTLVRMQQAAEAVAAMAESSRAVPEDRAYARAAYRAVDRAFPSTR
jgi:hypothetical protein